MLARLAPFLFVLLWSTGFLGAKLGLPHAAPLAFLLVRYLLVIALMTGIAPWRRALAGMVALVPSASAACCCASISAASSSPSTSACRPA
jgi:drug/metabolite transporter (DMT)-like permease